MTNFQVLIWYPKYIWRNFPHMLTAPFCQVVLGWLSFGYLNSEANTVFGALRVSHISNPPFISHNLVSGSNPTRSLPGLIWFHHPIPDHHPIIHTDPPVDRWLNPPEALGDFTFWRHMEPSYAAISMASYTEAEFVSVRWMVCLLSGKGWFPMGNGGFS